MSLIRSNALDVPIKYGSIQFNAKKIRENTGKSQNIILYYYNDTKFYINVSNTHLVLLYNNNKYHFARFIRPQDKPIKQKYRKQYKKNYLIHYNTALNKYQQIYDKYVIRDEGRSKLISHLEVWVCSKSQCNAAIVLNGLDQIIYNHKYSQHSHPNTITQNSINIKMRNSALESHVILHAKSPLKTIYDKFLNISQYTN